jgi:uncharacterized RDD family membrane protein YckC
MVKAFSSDPLRLMADDRRQLDNTIEIVTPENIAFRYQVAGPFRRLPAYLIDLALRIALFVLASMALSIVFGLAGLPGMGTGLVLVFWFMLEWFYGGLFETFWNGQTPGKRMLRVRVLSVDGQPINGLQAVLRNVLRAVDQQPLVFSLVGLITASLNERFQRMGDLACGTMVVVDEPQWFHGVVRVNAPEAIRLAGQIPASFVASRTLARALAAYVSRRANFHPMRRLEIAWHLAEPLRERFDLPPGTDPDMLLSGLYLRTFITDWSEQAAVHAGSPFGDAGSPFAAPGQTPLPNASPVTANAAIAVEAVTPAEAMAAADQGQPPLSALEERS